MTTTDRILGEARKVRPPTEKELTDPEWAYLYARDVIGGRWPEGEAAIATDRKWAYMYAAHVICGRFPEGEEAIAKDTHRAYAYARDVIRGRWPEGEEAIAKATDPFWTQEYLKLYPDAKREWVIRGWFDWFDYEYWFDL